ncbi:MAG: MBL fold metallo-hydrolase [Promethearchaeota archaeon]|nr:MAG: MBL fold metallo-hydrolase [Candidatus Lokiarchaeota archaeon]
MVKITFLGGCREVGRSGVLIESKNQEKCIIDYGIRFRGKERLPLDFDYNNLKAVALTHCHIDHSGALPFIFKNNSVPFFTNAVSLEITEILIRDMIRISNYAYPFGLKDLNKMMQYTRFLENGVRQKIGKDFYISFINAGHIPGSVSILIEVDNKIILYTGDINNQITNLVNPTSSSFIPEIDALITESTYVLRNHPGREDLEKNFAEKIIDITENDGKVLIPAFGVARSQEALLILQKYGYKGKIFIDGLARKISTLLLNFPESLKNIKMYRKALNNAQFLSRKGRNIAKRSNGVIIAPSGMLRGGPSKFFVESILNDPKSAIYLIGYQVEGSPGRSLLDKGIIEFKEKFRRGYMEAFKIEAKCDYDYFDFSSHADGAHIRQYIEDLRFRDGSNFIFCIHGDKEATTTLANEMAKKSYSSVAPEIGEVYKI